MQHGTRRASCCRVGPPLWLAALILAGGLPAAPAPTGKRWLDMDYGPFLSASIEAPQPRTNIACKGIALNLGAAFGGRQNEAVVFDTDLLRYAAGWTGNFVALKGTVFDGAHWDWPRIDGRQVFGNPRGPGWTRAGSFGDPREHPYGPLPREWAHWEGLYLHGRKVVLAYTVGGARVLELPAVETAGDLTAFTRTLNLDPLPHEQVAQVAFEPDMRGQLLGLGNLSAVEAATSADKALAMLGRLRSAGAAKPSDESLNHGLLARWEFNEAGGNRAADVSGRQHTLHLNDVSWTEQGHEGAGLEFDGRHFAEVAHADDLDFLKTDLTIAAWIQCRADGTILAQTTDTNRWVPDGRTLFVRGGRLTFDVGWVGAVQSSATVHDGQWHHVALTWSRADGRVRLFVDGVADGSGTLKPRRPLPNPVTRVGFTAPNFPASPWFRGRLDGLRVYGRVLTDDEVAALAQRVAREEVLAAGVVGAPADARWRATDDGHIRLQLPATTAPAKCKILLWRGRREMLPTFAELVRKTAPPDDLAPLTRGGPARWTEKPVTQGRLGPNDGPYAVDALTEPEENPWHSWLRFGGLDFFADGRRAALCTWSGDVWIVSGVEGDLSRLVWQRVATGLFQPLGLKIVEDQIYVLGRDQITRLHDLNGDGEADFYENFNNDCMVSEHFHEFATDLKLGPDGNFYYMKCACHGIPAKHPHHGCLMRVSRDGSKLEVIARGFRANNGIGVGPQGELTSIDNQGHWMPGNRLNWIQPGGWYGYQWAWNPAGRTHYDEPLCWMHNFVDRSGGTQLWVPDDRWGPLRGELITVSYGMGHIFLVLKERVGDVMQGAVTRLPLEFETGVMRGAFHPGNGQLYVAGLYGWAGNKTRAGGFYRVRRTDRPLHLPNALHVARDGLVLGFTNPLDEQSATDPGNYDVKAWNYQWTANYGSPDFRLDGREGRDTWRVESATASADRRTVFLKLPDMQRVMQFHLTFDLKAADGAPVRNFVHGTIHALGAKSGAEWLGPGAIARSGPAPVRPAREAPGLVQTFAAAGHPALEDARVARLAALFVPGGTPPTPFLPAGPFPCRWEGYLKLDLNEAMTFQFEGRGAARLQINGAVVLEARGDTLDGLPSQPTALRGGLNRFELDYESPARGDAEFRLLWASERLHLEPVPPTVFVHDAGHPALREREQVRAGRALFAERRCARCHRPDAPWPKEAMPELAAEGPSFNGIGSRLNEVWMATWVLDPKSIRPDALMPRLPHGETATADARDIAAFLASLREPAPRGDVSAGGRTRAFEPVTEQRPSETLRGMAATGAKLFTDLGCVACHYLPGDVTLTNDTRVPLGHVKAKWQPGALEEFLRAPAKHFPWTRMPDFKLSTNEAAALSAFVLERGAAVRPAAPAAAGSPERGRQLVTTLGCLACHPLDGEKDASTAASLADVLRRDWTRGCVTDDHAAAGLAPDFGFTAAQRQALRAFARGDALASLQRDAAVEFAARQYDALRCNACHPRDHETDLLTALTATQAKPSGDDEAAGSVHVGRPPLTFAGEKLYAGWIERFLAGTLPYKPRPQAQGRMPAFAAPARGLAAGIAHQHGYRAESAPWQPVDARLADVGRKLTGATEGFGCIACHDVGAQKALAGKDTATVNFVAVAERLRESYYWRYVADPPHVLSSTMMPKFIGDDGTTPIKSVFDGDPRKQFSAIWHYLHSLRNQAGPAGGP